ncbi:hypothetical protein S245_009981 [Arachis hypogaea]
MINYLKDFNMVSTHLIRYECHTDDAIATWKVLFLDPESNLSFYYFPVPKHRLHFPNDILVFFIENIRKCILFFTKLEFFFSCSGSRTNLRNALISWVPSGLIITINIIFKVSNCSQLIGWRQQFGTPTNLVFFILRKQSTIKIQQRQGRLWRL